MAGIDTGVAERLHQGRREVDVDDEPHWLASVSLGDSASQTTQDSASSMSSASKYGCSCRIASRLPPVATRRRIAETVMRWSFLSRRGERREPVAFASCWALVAASCLGRVIDKTDSEVALLTADGAGGLTVKAIIPGQDNEGGFREGVAGIVEPGLGLGKASFSGSDGGTGRSRQQPRQRRLRLGQIGFRRRNFRF